MICRDALFHLILLNFIKFLMYAPSFYFMGNYHYMPFIISFLYLFWPEKKRLLPLMLISFYLGAGVLKLNQEWLSGASLFTPRHFWVTPFVLRMGCFFVVGMELILIWGMISSDSLIRWTTLFILSVFHGFSWFIVGFFYPIVMILLLGLFPLLWLESKKAQSPRELFLSRGFRYLPLFVFFACQAIPWLTPGDPALTGEGRFFSLNMFDARAQCRVLINGRFHNLQTKELTPEFPRMGGRVKCDPYVYFQYSKWLCKTLASDPTFVDLDFFLANKRSTALRYEVRVDQKDFCASHLTYSVFGGNTWIRK